MNAFRPHHLDPRLETARVALVCRDWTGGHVSHVGLRISDEFPEISFIMVCHSNVGFLSADPHAIRIMREMANLQLTLHNVFIGGNSDKFVEWATETWGVRAMWVPNLYCMDEVFSHRDRNWVRGRHAVHHCCSAL